VSEPIWFDGPEGWRAWLEAHHDTATEVWVGMYKKRSPRHTMTWSQAVDEALCFGWIDGVMHRVDDERHAQRFTPRKPTSNWSAVNIAKVAALRAEGRMRPAGEAAFAKRREDRTAVYSYERRGEAVFSDEQRAALDADEAAAAFFDSQPPGYRQLATYWVVSAKKPETRERRMAQLIEDSAAGRRLKQFSRP
jgi:uncharacterized protein YdeI (YjbR/CyaY-like superfamily)